MLFNRAANEDAVRTDPAAGVFTPLKLKNGFDSVKADGKRIADAFFILLYLQNRDEASRKFGIICSRKFDKRAVKRNRARRLLREAVRQLKGTLPCTLLLIPKRKILEVKSGIVAENLRKAAAKARLFTENCTGKADHAPLQ